MKKFLIIGGILVAVAAIWYFFFRKPATAKNPAGTNANTASTPGTYVDLWGNATTAALRNAQAISTGVFGLLGSLSNAFGSNDGGANPGVAISGSNHGGNASSGSGTAVPNDGGIPDIFHLSDIYDTENLSPVQLSLS